MVVVAAPAVGVESGKRTRMRGRFGVGGRKGTLSTGGAISLTSETALSMEAPLGKPNLLEPSNEYVVDEPMLPITREIVLAVNQQEEVPEKTPIDYVATIIEVLDFKILVRLNILFQTNLKYFHSYLSSRVL